MSNRMSSVAPAEPQQNLESAILDLVQTAGAISFAELCRLAEWEPGEFEFGIPERNVIFWCGMSERCVEVLERLFRSRRICFEHVPVWVYFVDGRALTLPIAENRHSFDRPHWLPVVLNLVHSDSE